MYEQMELIDKAQEQIQRAWASLGNMPDQANALIHFLNNNTKEQLAALEINDRTGTILTVKKVLTMRTLIQTLERRCQDMQMDINTFTEKLKSLQQRGLPSLVTSNQKLLLK